MKLITAAALVVATGTMFGQSAYTGVSTPDQTIITANPDPAPVVPKVKPSAALPAAAPTANVYGPYVPYHAPGTTGAAVTAAESRPAYDADADIITSANVVPAESDTPGEDSGIVTSVPEREGELREGTLLKVRLRERLSTTTTVAGTPFTAELVDPVMKSGRVILPEGSVVEGRVTEVHSGKRIAGAASMHLMPREVTLPDGTHYVLHATLIDTNQFSQSKVNSEGTLVRRDHPKETLAVVGGVTGAGAVTGAVIGGGVGAVVGASIGAGVSTVMWLKQDRQEALPKDSLLVFSLSTPMMLQGSSTGTMSSLAVPGAKLAPEAQ
jgi:hypothetical protein